MAISHAAFINSELSKPTSIFGLRLWVVIGIFFGSTVLLLSLCITSRHRRLTHKLSYSSFTGAGTELTPAVSKQIQEIVPSSARGGVHEIQIDIGKLEHRVVFSDKVSSGESMRSANAPSESNTPSNGPEVSHLEWGRWYTLRELEVATNGLADENVIGEGGYGIVYRGVLADSTRVAVKNPLNNRYVAPEYACTGMLTEKSDIYSFGILIMEIISGRPPVDHSRPPGETQVGNRTVVDPKLPEMPTSRALKRILLVALRCVDPDGPKMGHVIHMLEADDRLTRDERGIARESSVSIRNYPAVKDNERQFPEDKF